MYVALIQIIIVLLGILGFAMESHLSINMELLGPLIIGVAGLAEVVLLSGSGRLYQKEEAVLKANLMEVFYSWRNDYGIVAKMRKSRGHINNAKSSTYYCVMLEKICEGVDVDTASLSSFQSTTDIESEFDDAKVDVVDELPP
jgi:hypothetical protein